MPPSSLLLFCALQVGPFWQSSERSDFAAFRPFWARQEEKTDVLWPLYTSHRDWWRFCFFAHYQENDRGGYQFDLMPFWFNGRARADAAPYHGLFPFYGRHPHFATVYDLEFVLWPVWMRYRTPRPSSDAWLTSNAMLFPFFHWRSDGAWGAWPFYVRNFQRESTHETALWPFVTWASYREDRDTAGAGRSWMVWPFAAHVDRARESQWMFLPPLFGRAVTPDSRRDRWLWPLVEIERGRARDRTSVFPVWEHVVNKRFADGEADAEVTRYLYCLAEVYRNEDGETEETRVFPFWVKSRGYFRLWPFYEETAEQEGAVLCRRALSLMPIRWVDSVDRNWAKFWTFYESVETPCATRHSLLWGLIKWRTFKD